MVTVGEVHLPVVKDTYGLTSSGELRVFQEQFIDCVKTENTEVIQLIAPTGAGKTLCFEYLLQEGSKVLLLYPTNALIQSQMERFRDVGFRAANISAKILKKSEFSSIVNRRPGIKAWAKADLPVDK